jgi:hypothetical protein
MPESELFVTTAPAPVKRGPGFKDLAGKRFTRLLVISAVEPYVATHRWLCLCDCEKLVAVISSNLLRGTTTSCGCLGKELVSQRSATHRMTKTRTYVSWVAMIRRCTNPKNDNFANYGGRGIKVSERWMSFENFFADMGERPEGKTIERNDVNGNYEKSNCRWATSLEQVANTTKTRMLDAFGRRMPLAAWSREYGISRQLIDQRIKDGWTVARAIATPPKIYSRRR